MAVPTISSVSPSSGSTRGGNLLTIEGTNFREPTLVQMRAGTGHAVPTVSVMFDGVSSEYAHAVTDTKIIAKVPQWRGEPTALPKAMIVRVANLDDDLNEIAGENVELADGYTVERPKLVVSGIEVRVMQEFLQELRRHVHPNVWFTTERFYWDMEDGVPEEIKKASNLPLIHVNGMSFDPNDLQQTMGGVDVEVSASVWETYRDGTAVDIILPAIEVYSKAPHEKEIYALGRALVKFASDCPFLRVSPEAWEIGAENYEYPLSMPDDGLPSYEMGPSLDGLKHCRAGMVIEGIELNDPNEQPVEWTKDWESLELDFQAT